MKTTFMANASNIERKWYVVDAEGQTVGRLAAEVAKVLRGKNKPTFTPHVDTGDYVIVINAEKVKFTGKKLTDKTYFRHSGYQGGTTFTAAGHMLERFPGARSRACNQGHAAEEPSRRSDVPQAQRLRWPGASACSSEAGEA